MKWSPEIKSIKGKILIPVIALIILGMGLSTVISYVRFSDTLGSVLTDDIEHRANSTIEIINSWTKDRTLDIKSWSAQKVFQIAVKDSFMAKSARKSSDEQLAHLKQEYGYYENLCVADLSGVVVSAADPSVIGNINVSDQNYFKQALKDQLIISEVFQSRQTGQPVFVIAVPLAEGNQIVGVFFSMIDLKSVSRQFIDPIKVGKSGYAYLYDTKGLVVAHPDKDRILKLNIGDFDFGRDMLSRKQGVITYTFEGIEKKASFAPIEQIGLFLAVTIPVDEIMAPVKALGRFSLVVTISVIVVAAALIFFVISLISRQLNQVVAGLRDAAEGEGDLTKRIAIASRDEVGELAYWFNVFIEKIQNMIKQMAKNASELGNSSKGLSQISEHLAKGADQTSGKALTVSSASEQMSGTVAMAADVMKETTSRLSIIAASTEEMSSTISEIAAHAEKGRQIAEEAVGQTSHASTQIEELGNAAQQIGKVVETITDISEQVNLLALNATIEAARAGEAGKGFAVVANEIKDLAKQTAAASGEIKQQVQGIQTSTHGTVAEIASIAKVVGKVNEIVSTIATAVEEQSVTTRDIAGTVADASEGVGRVNSSIADGAKAATTITADIAEVTDAASEISSSSAQVNDSSKMLSLLAEKLNTVVGQFKV